MSSKGVTIQLVDVLATSYSPPLVLKQSEPVVLRREQAIKTITGLTKPSYRLGLSVIDNNALDNDSELTKAIVQNPNVDEINQLQADLSQGFVNVTVKYSLRFELTSISPYYVTPMCVPGTFAFVAGDLAISPYECTNRTTFVEGNDYGQFIEKQIFHDDGGNNGTTPIVSTAQLTGAGFPLYRYDGTGWLPCVLDTNSNSISKYKIRVIYDLAYVDNWYSNNLTTSMTTETYEGVFCNYYYLVQTRISGNTGNGRLARFLNLSNANRRVADLSCGNTSSI